jgi:hypothetical protein
MADSPGVKKTALLTALFLIATAATAVAGTIRVYNNDSKVHTVELRCSGSSKKIEIRGSTTASYTFHSSSKECDIVGGTVKFPTKKLVDGQKWKIKNGEAKPN